MELLAKIQRDLKAPKNLYNSFSNYNYRNAEGILDAVKPLLNGGTIICSDELVMFGDRFYVKATATLSDGKESISSTAFAREAETKKGMDESQITGSASSYARKYALNGLFAIDDVKDADAHDNTKEPEKQAPKQAERPVDDRPWISEKQVNAAILRIQAGEDLYPQLDEAFRMAKVFREQLKNVLYTPA